VTIRRNAPSAPAPATATNTAPRFAPTSSQRVLCEVQEVATRLHRCPRTIRNWIRSGTLIAHNINGRYLIDENDIAQFLASHRGRL